MLKGYGTSDWDGIVGALYDAALDENMWRGLAPRIAETLGASSAVLKVHGAGGRIDLVETTANMVIAPADQAWANHWHDKDIWVQRSVAHGLSKVVIGEQLLAHRELEASAFYHEWLNRLDIYHMIGAAFSLDRGGVGVLGVHRAQGQAGFGEDERAAIYRFLPHLQRALKVRNAVSHMQIDTALRHNALDAIATGVAIVDARQRVRFANHQAEILFRQENALRVVGGRLTLADHLLDGRFTQMVHNACGEPGVLAAPHALAIGREDCMALTLLVMPLRNGFDGRGAEQMALVAICDPQLGHPSPHLLRELFSFTRSEALVAAYIARGMSPAAIAARLGIGSGTVKTHLKNAMAKTGTHSQAALASLIASSVGAMVRWDADN